MQYQIFHRQFIDCGHFPFSSDSLPSLWSSIHYGPIFFGLFVFWLCCSLSPTKYFYHHLFHELSLQPFFNRFFPPLANHPIIWHLSLNHVFVFSIVNSVLSSIKVQGRLLELIPTLKCTSWTSLYLSWAFPVDWW